MVRGEGVEPSQPCGQQPLKLSRLPFRHPRKEVFLFYCILTGSSRVEPLGLKPAAPSIFRRSQCFAGTQRLFGWLLIPATSPELTFPFIPGLKPGDFWARGLKAGIAWNCGAQKESRSVNKAVLTGYRANRVKTYCPSKRYKYKSRAETAEILSLRQDGTGSVEHSIVPNDTLARLPALSPPKEEPPTWSATAYRTLRPAKEPLLRILPARPETPAVKESLRRKRIL